MTVHITIFIAQISFSLYLKFSLYEFNFDILLLMQKRK